MVGVANFFTECGMWVCTGVGVVCSVGKLLLSPATMKLLFERYFRELCCAWLVQALFSQKGSGDGLYNEPGPRPSPCALLQGRWFTSIAWGLLWISQAAVD